MELYWASGCPYAWRVMLGLWFKDLDYTDHLLSLQDREHKQAGYTALNPRGKVPTLIDGEVVVTESLAILAYLDHVYRRHPLFGTSGYQAAQLWRRVMEIENYLVQPVDAVIGALTDKSWPRDVNHLKVETSRIFDELDRVEVEAPAGEFTAVDCVLVPVVKTLERASLQAGGSNIGLMPFPLQARWPKIASRLAEIEQIEGYERTFPPHWR